MIYPNLRAELARKGWSVERLANEVGVPYATLRGWLYGKCAIKFSDARKIKRALEVDIPLEVLFEEKTGVVA